MKKALRAMIGVCLVFGFRGTTQAAIVRPPINLSSCTPIIKSGTATHPQVVHITGPLLMTKSSNACITISGSYIVLNGNHFPIKRSAGIGSSAAVLLTPSAHDVTVVGLLVTATTPFEATKQNSSTHFKIGIADHGGDHITIMANEIMRTAVGIASGGKSMNRKGITRLIQSNFIHDVYDRGIWLSRVRGTSTQDGSSFKVLNNTVQNSNGSKGADGLELFESVNILARSNKFINGKLGIYLMDTGHDFPNSDNLFQNNETCHNSVADLRCDSPSDVASAQNRATGNIFGTNSECAWFGSTQDLCP